MSYKGGSVRRNFGVKQICLVLWVQVVVAIAFMIWGVVSGPQVLKILGIQVAGFPLDLALRIDALSALVFLMVSVLGLVIGQFGVRYLDGEPEQYRFYKVLLQTILAVSVLVLSNNLLMFFGAWLLISMSLHKLLLFYGDRRTAVYAARKKLLISRLGDVALLAAIAILYKITLTFDFDGIFAKAVEIRASGSEADNLLLGAAALLVALGAMTKSAQFPFHFWLPETMDTPTPVSALMHAGIINAGGFLVLRMSPILSVSDWADMALATGGAFTAVYGSLVMTTQNDIKKKLAYSTISQMGLMMFACGIGASGFALFHIVAHSFYKAYAFLSTGFLVEESKRLSVPMAPLSDKTSLVWIALGFGVLYFGMTWQDGVHLGAFSYLGVLVLGLSQTNPVIPKALTGGIIDALNDKSGSLEKPVSFKRKLENRVWFSVQRRTLGAQFIAVMLLATGAYFVLELGLGHFMEITMGENFGKEHAPDNVMLIVAFSAYAFFAFGYWLNNHLIKADSEWSRRLYVNLWNGSFFGVKSDRFLSRFWPA